VLLVLILISLDYCLCSASACGVKLKNCQFELIFQDVYDCLPSPTAASRCGLMGVRLIIQHSVALLDYFHRQRLSMVCKDLFV